MDQSLYRSIIISLLYLTTTQPNITFFWGVYACYQAKPKVSHLVQVKRINKYINGTCDYGILYSHVTNYIIIGYWYADWAGNAEE